MCENTSSFLSVGKTLSTASLSDDELDFEKQQHMQQLEKEISDEPNFDVTFRESFQKALPVVKMEKIDRSSTLTVLQAIEHYPQIVHKVANTVTALATYPS